MLFHILKSPTGTHSQRYEMFLLATRKTTFFECRERGSGVCKCQGNINKFVRSYICARTARWGERAGRVWACEHRVLRSRSLGNELDQKFYKRCWLLSWDGYKCRCSSCLRFPNEEACTALLESSKDREDIILSEYYVSCVWNCECIKCRKYLSVVDEIVGRNKDSNHFWYFISDFIERIVQRSTRFMLLYLDAAPCSKARLLYGGRRK